MRLRTLVGTCLIVSCSAAAAQTGADAWRKQKPPEDPPAGQAGDEAWRTRKPPEIPAENSRPAGDTQASVIRMTFEMPKAFIPDSAPREPLDRVLRVGLLLPTANESSTSELSFYYTPWLSDPPVQKLVSLQVDHAKPVSEMLPAIVGRLFSRVEILDRGSFPSPASELDLVLDLTVQARNLLTPSGTFVGVRITGTLTAGRGDGTPLSMIQGTGDANVSTWSLTPKIRARRVGVVAIEKMVNQLVRKVIDDPAINEFLHERAAARARPSQLETTFRLTDDSSILPNGRLDAGESAQLAFTVRNRGAGRAFGVRLRLSAAQKELTFPAEASVGDILPDAESTVVVPISAGLGVPSETAQIHVDTVEKRGYGGRAIVAEIATEQLHPPTLEIADVSLGAGLPANGETLEATVVVRNAGPGPAVGGALYISADDPRITVVEPKLDLPPIAVDDTAQTRVRIRVPVTYDAGSLALTLRAVEARGESVAQTRRAVVWKMDFRRPAVDFAYRLYDGNSVGSKGNRDGIANSGEQLELVFTAANRGALTARGVQLSIASLEPSVTLQPDRLAIGDLAPNVEAPEQRVVVQIPRTAGRDAAIRTLPLSVTTTQSDFETRDTRIDLAFEANQPRLTVTLADATESLAEGATSTLWLDVRNQGLLAAEQVQVEVTSANGAVDLLDERGAPVAKRLFDVGTVGARTTVPRIELKVHAKRTSTAAEALLKAVASQQDFPPVLREAALRIEREQAARISVVPAARPERPGRIAPAPATVSFRRYEEEEHIALESIELRFEVQSANGIDRVRLEHNGRVIEVDPFRIVPGPGGRLWEFEQPIRLDYGANTFEIVVVTAEGLRSSRTLTIHRDRPDSRIWLAVIGISKYENDDITDLAFAREDAAAVAAYYRERFGLEDDQIIQLLDEDATLSNIKRRLGRELIAKAINPNDTVILYFAGHGQKDRDRASADADGFTKYILPYDADPADPFSTALSMEELARILQRLQSERVALVLDSCFSGAAEGGRTLFDPAVRSRGVMSNEFLSRLAGAGNGRVVLTASGADEIAVEPANLGHGVFTYYFLEGLRGAADDDRDGQVDVDEIYKYVSRKVVNATRGSQRPMKKASSQTGVVVLGKTSVRARE